VHSHVPTADRPEGEHQGDQEPRAERGGRQRLPATTERERHPEGEGEDAAHQPENEDHAAEPAMEVEVAFTKAPPQLERCPEEVEDARHDVRVCQPRIRHVPGLEAARLGRLTGGDERGIGGDADGSEHQDDGDEQEDHCPRDGCCYPGQGTEATPRGAEPERSYR
jgi:hypothetical protein